MRAKRSLGELAVWLAAVAAPIALTATLLPVGGYQRDYIFLYLGIVAVLGLLRGLWPALVSAALSFLLVDYFFIPPVGSFTITDRQDAVNLLAFAASACLVALLASHRRRALLDMEALARQLRDANTEMVRLNSDQAAAAQAAIRLARSEQQIRNLEEGDRLRRDLLANISHELRTPLATILAESTDSTGARTGREGRRRLDVIAAEARRLKALVDDMLDMARIEGGGLSLHFEPILLEDAITAAVDRLHHPSPRRDVEWDESSAAVEVLADWDALGQVFDNLFANADRFGPSETPITVAVSREEPGLVTVRVTDQGPGVPGELRDHIFDRFVRAPAKDGSEVGTGLGLPIVKGLVQAHAGSVSLEDGRDGAGATFRFTLPEAPAEP